MKLTQEIVRELLDYDPETGIMRWKARAIEWFSVENVSAALPPSGIPSGDSSDRRSVE